MTYLYIPSRTYNMNALDFYLRVMEEASVMNNEPVTRISSLDIVKSGDKVLAFNVNDSARVILKKRGVKVYTWYQGVTPEEMSFNASGLNKIIQYIKWSLCDIISLWGSRANIYVSEAMARHNKRKYCFFKDNYVVMPCFNQGIEPESFIQEKYNKPRFVYSGSLAKWQCFDRVVATFVEIKHSIPDAQFSVFTNSVERAKEIVESAGLKDVDVRNVPYQDLPEEMNKYKYGFLIRDSITVNKVATPTKMSSYMGCGIIPIFSPVIEDFNTRLGNLKYIVTAGTTDEMINKLKELEKIDVKAEDVYAEYKTVFDDYYCREKYIKLISELYKKYC